MTNYRERLYKHYRTCNPTKQVRSERPTQSADADDFWDYHVYDWIKDLPRGAKVVDLGCGSGNFVKYLRSKGFQTVIGVESSPEQVQEMQKANLDVMQQDLFTYLKSLPDEELGLIVLFDVVEHLTRDEVFALFDLAIAKLSSGGKMLIQIPNGDSPFFGSIYWDDPTHETAFTARSLYRFLRGAGFASVQFSESFAPPIKLRWAIRFVLWKIIRGAIKFIHHVETGGRSSGYYSRVIRCIATK